MDNHRIADRKSTADRDAEFNAALQAYIRSYREEQRRRNGDSRPKPVVRAFPLSWLLAYGRS